MYEDTCGIVLCWIEVTQSNQIVPYMAFAEIGEIKVSLL